MSISATGKAPGGSSVGLPTEAASAASEQTGQLGDKEVKNETRAPSCCSRCFSAFGRGIVNVVLFIPSKIFSGISFVITKVKILWSEKKVEAIAPEEGTSAAKADTAASEAISTGGESK